MAGFLTSGAVLLVVLIASSYGYPSKMALAPAPAPAAPEVVVQPQPATYSVQPVAVSQGTNIPAASGYIRSAPGGFQHASDQEVAWEVQPLSLLTGVSPAAAVDAEPLGLGYGNQPQYNGGDLSQYGGSYEHGNSESETHGLGYQSQSLDVQAPAEVQISEAQPLGLSSFGSWPSFSYLYDYMFMTGQYPPGTLTHSSESFEQGADHWQDAHYQRYYIPSYTITELQPAPVQQAPKGKMPSQPVKQTVGKGGY
ncbi:uncharacterized protein LOC117824100 [Notolabrus celidotus]|uniref:uncharacterized protein LOC117824100 n=1 Tax=Notolabrus celidotus TaxID=1203425 RepID=UPI001490090D|nr:uncharacterized protein LOC117824100 [Notolabrus celidotus]